MPDIVITEFMDTAAVDGLAKDFDTVYDPALVDRPGDLLPLLAGARGLIVRNRTQVRGDLLAAGGDLRVVGRLGVGLDNIDMDACAARGITVCPATGANDAAVAEYVIATAMVLLRRAYDAAPRVIAGEWPRQDCMGREIGGKVLGLLGFGGIARQTAVRAAALGMTVIAHDPFVAAGDGAWTTVAGGVGRRDLGALLAEADVLSLHVPLTEGTRNVLDAAAVARMKPGAVLVDTARGGVVDEAAVVAALNAGHLGAAAFDVFAGEPVDAAAGARFAGVPNLILTPHIAGVTQESNVRVSSVTADNVRRVLEQGA
ncbi:MAG: 3-phosphoglycerate dehydrogenase [Hyphomicrobiales bacterium]|nr:3-phosphoglycerate dehydrogenase [Hyphomicrobiales bacterium]